MPIRVIIATDTPLNAQLLVRSLNRNKRQFEVVSAEHTLRRFLKQAQEHKPDVAVISWGLQGDPQGGLRALRGLRLSGSTVRPIVLMDSRDPESVVTAFSAGAKGVLGSGHSFDALSKCIRSVHDGQVWANSEESQWVLKALTEMEPRRVLGPLSMSALTPRQLEIVRMVADGLPNKEIASSLGVSEHTVRNHLFRIYERLGVSNRVELVFYSLSERKNSEGPETNVQANR